MLKEINTEKSKEISIVKLYYSIVSKPKCNLKLNPKFKSVNSDY